MKKRLARPSRPRRETRRRDRAAGRTIGSAAQAVIAINNVGRFNEAYARTRDLEEVLRQQTATADVLEFTAAPRSMSGRYGAH